MKPRVLFVDDEINILESFRTSLRKLFQVEVAVGPVAGLEKVMREGPFPVVVSDLKMPEMDGIQFLAKVQEKHPDTVRVMLTGHADLDSAISAVNMGQVFRFLTKPCPHAELVRTLEAAVRQHNLERAERELLRGTLRGSIKVLTDILGLVNPEAFGRSERVKRLAVYIGQQLKLRQTLYLELAAMLSQLGCVTIPDTVMKKVYFGEELSAEEQQVYGMHPSVTASLLSQIPRMDKVSEIILDQDKTLVEKPNLAVEPRILKACMDYDTLIQKGLDKFDAIDVLRQRTGWYDSGVLDILERGTAGEEGYIRREMPLDDLKAGMILDQSLWSLDEVHIMVEGTELTDAALIRLNNFRVSKRLPSSVRVLIPIAEE